MRNYNLTLPKNLFQQRGVALVDLEKEIKALIAASLAANVLEASASLNFGSTATLVCTDLTIALPGAVLGDVVSLGVPHGSTLAAGSFSAWVSAADVVTVRFCNNSAGPLDPAAGTFKVAITK